MRELILGEFPTLGHLIGSLNTAKAVTCDLCGKKHKHTHDKDCGYFKGHGGDCNCDHHNKILEVAGLCIVNECCGTKLMEIIACLMPAIAENIAPLLRKYSNYLTNTANRFCFPEQWCVFRKKNGPTRAGLVINIESVNGVPVLLIETTDKEQIWFSPATDVIFHSFNDKATAIAFCQQLENPK